MLEVLTNSKPASGQGWMSPKNYVPDHAHQHNGFNIRSSFGFPCFKSVKFSSLFTSSIGPPVPQIRQERYPFCLTFHCRKCNLRKGECQNCMSFWGKYTLENSLSWTLLQGGVGPGAWSHVYDPPPTYLRATRWSHFDLSWKQRGRSYQ